MTAQQLGEMLLRFLDDLERYDVTIDDAIIAVAGVLPDGRQTYVTRATTDRDHEKEGLLRRALRLIDQEDSE